MGDLDRHPAELSLTHQEVELLQLLGQGLPLGTVARRLRTSERTVRRRTKAICERVGVDFPIQAVVWAAQRGLIRPCCAAATTLAPSASTRPRLVRPTD
jgi:DNA-binding NarL/FixJ family response regulator